MTHILLTNDDGYEAPGLRALAAAFEGFATVSIVAPSREQSGAAQSLTLRQPIVCHSIAEREWAIDGTPADCVIVALHKLLPERPDMVISGINFGANLGENVYYSGTVGAAREAALHHLPALAMSLCSKIPKVSFENAARVARRAAEMVLKEGLPDQVLLNVNVPRGEIKGIRLTRLGHRVYREKVIREVDPRGRPYYWIGAGPPEWAEDASADIAAMHEGWASVTPLHLDLTHHGALGRMTEWEGALNAVLKKKKKRSR